ncbi:hypothetical protein B296_00052364 [Ensete ventricosum]|uniref:Uncharacterized protein n=1 Tax=Ensete ventricosum TaxID=4639 RepID=A0A426XVZ3_ENSVE|nr:hypothetical protein B296_00052364 [Ensete ventricosum]
MCCIAFHWERTKRGERGRREREDERRMRWAWDQQKQQQLLLRGWENRGRVWAGAVLLWLLLMLVTPRIAHSHALHLFADMRNFLGEPLPPPPLIPYHPMTTSQSQSLSLMVASPFASWFLILVQVFRIL